MECDCGIKIGDFVKRASNNFTLTGHNVCRVVGLKEVNGELLMFLELDDPKSDPELARILAQDDCWHKARFWERV